MILFHKIADADCAEIRRAIVDHGLKPRVDFQNILQPEGDAALAARGGRAVPALWDGERLHQGRDAVVAALRAIFAPR